MLVRHKEVESSDTTPPKPLSELGVSKDQSSKGQKLTDAPEEDFEARFRQDLTVRNVPPITAERFSARVTSSPLVAANCHCGARSGPSRLSSESSIDRL